MTVALSDFQTMHLLTSAYEYDAIEQQVKGWQRTLFKLQKILNEDYPDAADAANLFKKKVDEFSLHLPVIKCLMSEALKDEDWDEIKEKIGQPELEQNSIAVNKFEEFNITSHLADIEEITNRAEKKFQLNKKLKAMKEEMKEFKLEPKVYKDTYILGGYEAVYAKLDDQIVATQAMLGSSNCKQKLRGETKNWEAKLNLMSEIIIEINKCQRQWMYLEPIFGSEDIGKTLANELAMF